MNHCMLMAEISTGPQLRYTQDNQTPIAELMISLPGLRPEDAPQQMKVVGWGNLATEIQETYQVGDRILIEGRLTTMTVDRPEGFKEKQAELTAQKIVRLSDLSSSLDTVQPSTPPVANHVAVPTPVAAASPVGPTSTSPAAESEVDYDDIPF